MADILVKLGALLEGPTTRDAIHVAVAPVIAADDLDPGQQIGFIDYAKNAVSWRAIKMIGIVDPFLTRKVKKGQQFYMLLIPYTITGLHHQWSHPEFDKVDAAPAEAKKEEARQWLENFASGYGMNFADMVQEANSCGYITAIGSDLHGPGELGSEHETFWEMMEVFTGRRFDQIHRENTGWTCSC